MIFIPLAEQTGLIDEISQWVLRSVCNQIRSWEAAGYGWLLRAGQPLRLEFRNRDLAAKIINLLQKSGCLQVRLRLRSIKLLLCRTWRRQWIYFRISTAGRVYQWMIFGTGYSSLNYLRRFPLSKVKIDRSFITDFTHAQNDAAIVSAIIAMSHSLGLRVRRKVWKLKSSCVFSRIFSVMKFKAT